MIFGQDGMSIHFDATSQVNVNFPCEDGCLNSSKLFQAPMALVRSAVRQKVPTTSSTLTGRPREHIAFVRIH